MPASPTSRRSQAGKADLGFGNSISTVDGVAGRAPFDAKATNVCNVASLYPQYFQVVANADSGINSLADLKGKPVAFQPKGNTAEFISQQALEVYGLKPADLGRVSYVSYTDAVSLMKDNNAQAFTLGTTVPASAIMDLASARDIRLVGIPDDKFQAMRKLNPGYTKLVIPAGSYPKQTKDVQTIGYATHVIARCDLDPDVVYKVLKGMVEHKADLAAIAKAMGDTTPKMMAEDIGVPLHKGASATTRKSARSERLPERPGARGLRLARRFTRCRGRPSAHGFDPGDLHAPTHHRHRGGDVGVPSLGRLRRPARRLRVPRHAPGLRAGARLPAQPGRARQRRARRLVGHAARASPPPRRRSTPARTSTTSRTASTTSTIRASPTTSSAAC